TLGWRAVWRSCGSGTKRAVFVFLVVLGIIALVVIIAMVAVPTVRRSRSEEPARSTRQVTDTDEHPA
ncbi:MAG: hypothetical protein ACRDZ2_13030, partial [Ilumatobacteraceae bacterium]